MCVYAKKKKKFSDSCYQQFVCSPSRSSFEIVICNFPAFRPVWHFDSSQLHVYYWNFLGVWLEFTQYILYVRAIHIILSISIKKKTINSMVFVPIATSLIFISPLISYIRWIVFRSCHILWVKYWMHPEQWALLHEFLCVPRDVSKDRCSLLFLSV